MRVLDDVNARSLAGFGWESFAWVRCNGFADGVLPMGSIPGKAYWSYMGTLLTGQQVTSALCPVNRAFFFWRESFFLKKMCPYLSLSLSLYTHFRYFVV
jgi:hypothetical protein